MGSIGEPDRQRDRRFVEVIEADPAIRLIHVTYRGTTRV
jgi:hypothetical protein